MTVIHTDKAGNTVRLGKRYLQVQNRAGESVTKSEFDKHINKLLKKGGGKLEAVVGKGKTKRKITMRMGTGTKKGRVQVTEQYIK